MTAKFIAEVSSNHHRDLERCTAFIRAAARVGCTGVKFQLFQISQLFAPEALARNEALHRRVDWELPVTFLPVLADQCRVVGIEFGCTPFYLEAVEQLWPYVDFYKIASYELLWTDLLRACAATGKPVVLSTGMANLYEVTDAVATLRAAGCRDLTLLHCVSGYPTPAIEANLAAMDTLRQACACPVGWSDHTVEPGVLFRAVHRWNASMVEFHLDLDGTGDEFKTGHCWLPEQIQAVIAAARIGFVADGSSEKCPAPSSLSDLTSD